jgi:hypothetical protein
MAKKARRAASVFKMPQSSRFCPHEIRSKLASAIPPGYPPKSEALVGQGAAHAGRRPQTQWRNMRGHGRVCAPDRPEPALI